MLYPFEPEPMQQGTNEFRVRSPAVRLVVIKPIWIENHAGYVGALIKGLYMGFHDNAFRRQFRCAAEAIDRIEKVIEDTEEQNDIKWAASCLG